MEVEDIRLTEDRYIVVAVRSVAMDIVCIDKTMELVEGAKYSENVRKQDHSINMYDRYQFTGRNMRMTEIYNEIHKMGGCGMDAYTGHLQSSMHSNGNIISCEKITKMNGLNATYGDIYLWKEGTLHLQYIRFEFVVEKITTTRDFDIDQQLYVETYPT